MDKYEHRISLQEMDQLIGERRFDQAAGVADTIDWSAEKDPAILCKVSDVYKINREFAKSRRVLIMASQLDPQNPEIIYSLCELTIFLYGRDGLQTDLIAAYQLNQQYQQMQPGSPKSLILEYKLYKVTNVSAGEKIEILERLKSIQFTARWGYELALCYREAGNWQQAAAQCQEIMHSFQGKYAAKAAHLLQDMETAMPANAPTMPANAQDAGQAASQPEQPQNTGETAIPGYPENNASDHRAENQVNADAAGEGAQAEIPEEKTTGTAGGLADADPVTGGIHTAGAVPEGNVQTGTGSTAADAEAEKTASGDHAQAGAADAGEQNPAAQGQPHDGAQITEGGIPSDADTIQASGRRSTANSPETNGGQADSTNTSGESGSSQRTGSGQVSGTADNGADQSMTISEVMKEWYRIRDNIRSQNDQRRREKLMEDTGSLMNAFDEGARHTMLEDIERNIDRQQRQARQQSYTQGDLSDGMTQEERRRVAQAGYNGYNDGTYGEPQQQDAWTREAAPQGYNAGRESEYRTDSASQESGYRTDSADRESAYRTDSTVQENGYNTDNAGRAGEYRTGNTNQESGYRTDVQQQTVTNHDNGGVQNAGAQAYEAQDAGAQAYEAQSTGTQGYEIPDANVTPQDAGAQTPDAQAYRTWNSETGNSSVEQSASNSTVSTPAATAAPAVTMAAAAAVQAGISDAPASADAQNRPSILKPSREGQSSISAYPQYAPLEQPSVSPEQPSSADEQANGTRVDDQKGMASALAGVSTAAAQDFEQGEQFNTAPVPYQDASFRETFFEENAAQVQPQYAPLTPMEGQSSSRYRGQYQEEGQNQNVPYEDRREISYNPIPAADRAGYPSNTNNQSSDASFGQTDLAQQNITEYAALPQEGRQTPVRGRSYGNFDGQDQAAEAQDRYQRFGTPAEETEDTAAEEYPRRGRSTRRWSAADVRRAMAAQKERFAAMEEADRAALAQAVENAGREETAQAAENLTDTADTKNAESNAASNAASNPASNTNTLTAADTAAGADVAEIADKAHAAATMTDAAGKSNGPSQEEQAPGPQQELSAEDSFTDEIAHALTDIDEDAGKDITGNAAGTADLADAAKTGSRMNGGSAGRPADTAGRERKAAEAGEEPAEQSQPAQEASEEIKEQKEQGKRTQSDKVTGFTEGSDFSGTSLIEEEEQMERAQKDDAEDTMRPEHNAEPADNTQTEEDQAEPLPRASSERSNVSEDDATEDTAAGDTAAEDTVAGDTAAEDDAAEDTASENTAAEDTAAGDADGRRKAGNRDTAAAALKKPAGSEERGTADLAAQEEAEDEEEEEDFLAADTEERRRERPRARRKTRQFVSKQPAADEAAAGTQAGSAEGQASSGTGVQAPVVPASSAAASKEHDFSDEEKKLFGPIALVKANRDQILTALDNISMASETGNVIITGSPSVTRRVARGLLHIVRHSDSNFSSRVAEADGKRLNELGPEKITRLLDKIENGAIQITGAGALSGEVVTALQHELEGRERGIIVLLLDTPRAINALLKQYKDLLGSFNVRIDVRPLDDKALVAYGMEYALGQDYSIDEMAQLALSTRISSLQTRDHHVSTQEVRDIVDEAISYASRKSLRTFFAILTHKRYDADDRIIIREKDFMHY